MSEFDGALPFRGRDEVEIKVTRGTGVRGSSFLSRALCRDEHLFLGGELEKNALGNAYAGVLSLANHDVALSQAPYPSEVIKFIVPHSADAYR